MVRYLEYYLSVMRIAILQQLQYRIANYFFLFGMIAESIVYMVVWSTVAISKGGDVGGLSPGEFAAYFIVGIVVNNMSIGLSPYSWEWRVQRGLLSGELIYPIHPLHHDVAYYAGSNLVTTVLCIPIVAILAWLFNPILATNWYGVIVFFLSLLGAYLIYTLILSILGMITFWTTRVAGIYELLFALELLLSGRMIPLNIMPGWVQQIALYLPFQWTFYFPVESLIGNLSPNQLILGLGMQCGWIVIGIVGIKLIWRSGVRQYTAVGN